MPHAVTGCDSIWHSYYCYTAHYVWGLVYRLRAVQQHIQRSPAVCMGTSDPAAPSRSFMLLHCVYVLQGMGNLVNGCVILICMAMFGMYGSTLDPTASRNVIMIQFAVGAAVSLFMVLWRWLKLKESKVSCCLLPKLQGGMTLSTLLERSEPRLAERLCGNQQLVDTEQDAYRGMHRAGMRLRNSWRSPLHSPLPGWVTTFACWVPPSVPFRVATMPLINLR